MRGSAYSVNRPSRRQRRNLIPLIIILALLAIGGLLIWKFILPDPVERTLNSLNFDSSVSESEKQQIQNAISEQQVSFEKDAVVSVTSTNSAEGGMILNAYVPVTDFGSPKQSISSQELKSQIDDLPDKSGTVADVEKGKIVLIPISELTNTVKLLSLDEAYYLEDFNSGAVFRQAEFRSTDDNTLLDIPIKLSDLVDKDSILSFKQTGVTALTRMMMRKLSAVGGDAKYFSQKIGDFLADADLTHVSNEVSFKAGCTWHAALFCSPPEMIETLKASGVDIVELTGNHNNDVGAEFNTKSIELYHSLGWATVGGGLNTTEAAKPYLTENKGTKLALLAYNYPDSPNGGAIAGPNKAGANSWDINKIESDIKSAKENGNFVIVDIQFWECYAYPDGYVEFPECDRPIPNQASVFRQMIDLGADMVVGTSAHQPQTYELYKEKPIYYGLGNLYFDQDRWPGTERGIVLTHYFHSGKLLQTRLSPTVYDSKYQTELMTETDAVKLLERLEAARDF